MGGGDASLFEDIAEVELAEDDLFSIFESLESFGGFPPLTPCEDNSPRSKKRKLVDQLQATSPQKISHITVERNRRKQMNDHLSVLRSLMPGFYVKRGDQASIIGGVVDYINELHQVLQSLEAKKQRKSYSNEIVPSPRSLLSPRICSPLISPRKPSLSPRICSPLISPRKPSLSPRTPQPTSPYRPRPPPLTMLINPNSSSLLMLDPSSTFTTTTTCYSVENELVAASKSTLADVEVKFSGPNLVLKTVSPRIPGQALKIISAVEEHLSLEILHLDINILDDGTMLLAFTIKIGIECQLSAEELAQQIQQTFTFC